SETATAAVAVAAVAKPVLHGIVIDGANTRAFIEDPTVKRVGGYSVGDTVSGGKIQKIADDRIVIVRPEGVMEVLLQDPSTPRPHHRRGRRGPPAPGRPARGPPPPHLPGPRCRTLPPSSPRRSRSVRQQPRLPRIRPREDSRY